MAPTEPSERTAFVLAGGGSLGAVQVGMLAELIDAGLRPNLIVGVSAGALNGAFLASDPSCRMVEHMAMLWSRMTTREVLGLSWGSLLGLLGFRDHIAKPDGLRSLLKRELSCQTFAETALPLHLVCADLITGEEVVISSGNIAEAVIASTAIPGVFPPVEREGRYLIDGAVAACTPIAVAAALGATRIIVLPCGFACALNPVSKRAIGRAMHAITLLGAGQLRRDFEHYSQSVVMRIAPPVCSSRSGIHPVAMQLTEERLRTLMLESLAGEGPSYRVFLIELSTHLRAFLRRRLARRPEQVEDLVQELLLAIHNQRHTYNANLPLTAWVHSIARYKLIDWLRRRSRHDLLNDSLDDCEELFAVLDSEAGEASLDLARLLQLLPDRQRLPIQHVKVEGSSVADTAKRLGMSESAVKIGIHRGLKALAASIRAFE